MKSLTRIATIDTEIWTAAFRLVIVMAALLIGLALVVFPSFPRSAESESYILVWYEPAGQDAAISSGAQNEYSNLQDCEGALSKISSSDKERFRCVFIR